VPWSTTTTKPNVTTTTLPGTKECKSILKNGGSEKYDIVFIGDNINTMSDYSSNVNLAYNQILSTQPFTSNSNKFNVWRIDENIDLDCRDTTGDNCPECDSNKVINKVLENCGHYDQIIIFTHSSKWVGCRAGGYTFNSLIYLRSDIPDAAVHEFGHAFGGLHDEYDFHIVLINPDGTPAKSNDPNCDERSSGSGSTPCPKWSSVPNTGCYEVCGYSNWYKPAQKCIMNAGSLGSNEFCPVCRKRLESLLASLSLQAYHTQVQILQFSNKNGILSLTNISIARGITPQILVDAGYRLDQVSPDNAVIHTAYFQPSTKIFWDSFEKGKPYPSGGGVTELSEANFMVVLPYFTNSKSINLNNPQSIKTISIDVSDLGKKQLAIANDVCKAGSRCSSNLIGTCTDALFIALNKEGRPLTSPAVEAGTEIKYVPENSGKVRVLAICFEPQVKVVKTVIDVS
jgi:hypothetical protein